MKKRCRAATFACAGLLMWMCALPAMAEGEEARPVRMAVVTPAALEQPGYDPEDTAPGVVAQYIIT